MDEFESVQFVWALEWWVACGENYLQDFSTGPTPDVQNHLASFKILFLLHH